MSRGETDFYLHPPPDSKWRIPGLGESRRKEAGQGRVERRADGDNCIRGSKEETSTASQTLRMVGGERLSSRSPRLRSEDSGVLPFSISPSKEPRTETLYKRTRSLQRGIQRWHQAQRLSFGPGAPPNPPRTTRAGFGLFPAHVLHKAAHCKRQAALRTPCYTQHANTAHIQEPSVLSTYSPRAGGVGSFPTLAWSEPCLPSVVV